jgi:membrane associated rhomboid family serine protease
MYNDDLNAHPINPLPTVVIFLTCLIGGVELVFQAAEAGFLGGAQGIGWRVEAVQKFAFSDALFDWMRLNHIYAADNLVRFFSYIFIHQTLMHMVLSLVFILALGKYVAEIVNPFAVLAIFLASGAIGALVYSLVFDERYALVGSTPAVYGLLGAFTWLRFSKLKSEGENGFKAFNLIIFFMSIAMIFKVIFGGSNNWLAELTGFFVGFLMTIILGPDGKQRILYLRMLLLQR